MEPFVKISVRKGLYLSGMLVLMAIVLSISGFEQAGFGKLHTQVLWSLRALFGLLFLSGLFVFAPFFSGENIQRLFGRKRVIDWYNLAGFVSDGIGGVMLLLFGSTLYGFIGATFTGGYQQIVFGFVTGVGILHLMGYLFPAQAYTFARATVVMRVITAAGFFALYKSGAVGWIAYAVSAIDLLFVLLYLLIEPSVALPSLKRIHGGYSKISGGLKHDENL
jgi:hypothetical protein